MQMQPINPLCPLVAGANKTRPNSGENFIDSLLSVYNKSDTVSRELAEMKTVQQENNNATTSSPISDETTPTPKKPEKESNDHIESVAIEKQSSASDEKFFAANMMPADVLAGPVATQIRGLVAIFPGYNNGAGGMADFTAGNIVQQPVVDTPPYQNSASDPQPSVVVMQATNHIVPQQSAVAMLAAAQQVDFGEALPDRFPPPPPQDSKTNLLQAHFKLPHSPAPADLLPGRIISAVAYDPYVNDRKAGGPIDLRYVELVQNSETENLVPSRTRSDTATSPTDSRFAEILGLTTVPDSETVQRLVPQRQRSWGPEVEARVTDAAGEKTVARMAPLKISDQFMNEFGTDDPGKVIHWDRPADSMAVSSHAPGTGESSDFLHSLVPSQNTTPTTVISQDGATARNPAGLWSAENRIIDHVIKQVSIRSNLEQSSISIKLHPEELGHLKMELVADNETIKAYIHVQTQQVQDILEKNLARLREGFEQQGLVLDEIQVTVHSESKSGPDLFNDQQALHTRVQTANSTRTQESHDTISEETMVAPHRPDSIISLRI